ncbi:universal stress protein [Mycobacteroides salmoniphilum]|uniref:universal stress protein n=1 Tax=Mycobacteroides salmoniphilum TaxID=404941 RepID=UPI001F21A76D|nr:universal stress protein [Mycobacteroides salmoniphilum]
MENVMRDDIGAHKDGQGAADLKDDKPASAVVVGIDGSHRAIAAALWAVDEAVERDIPLRLIYAIEPRQQSDDDLYSAYDVATAEIATQGAVLAVQSCDRPVKLEVEILQGRAQEVLIGQSHSAALICVGALSRDRASDHRVASTAAALSRHAHCPVVVVRGSRYAGRQGSVLIEFEDLRDFEDELAQGLHAATLRGAAVQIIACRSGQGSSTYGADTDLLRARLNRLLEPWRHKYAGASLDVIISQRQITDYLAHERDSVQLLVVGRHRKQGVSKLIDQIPTVGCPGTTCTVMIGGHDLRL